jgi:hypothetical protein
MIGVDVSDLEIDLDWLLRPALLLLTRGRVTREHDSRAILHDRDEIELAVLSDDAMRCTPVSLATRST